MTKKLKNYKYLKIYIIYIFKNTFHIYKKKTRRFKNIHIYKSPYKIRIFIFTKQLT